VLDHLDGGLAPLERRAALSRDDVTDQGRDAWPIGQIAADEDHAGLGLGGSKPNADVGPGQKPDPSDDGLAGDCALLATCHE
jgi:hypothetical protein